MHAIQLAESGNLLMLPSRSGGSAEWIAQAQAMIDASNHALKTIDAKDKDALVHHRRRHLRRLHELP